VLQNCFNFEKKGDIIYDEKNFSKLEKILGASKRILQERETPGRMKVILK
jgi:hypothetical protein